MRFARSERARSSSAERSARCYELATLLRTFRMRETPRFFFGEGDAGTIVRYLEAIVPQWKERTLAEASSAFNATSSSTFPSRRSRVQ